MITRNQIKYIKDLSKKSFRTSEGVFVVEGEKLVDELLHSEFKIIEIFAIDSWVGNWDDGQVIRISDKDLSRISQLKTPNKVLALAKIPYHERHESIGNQLCVFLDRINDPGNLGTIIRMADWFGVSKIFCTEGSVDVYNAKVVQSSMGSIFRVEVEYVEPLTFLTEYQNNYPENLVIGAAMNGEKLNESSLAKNALLIMGSESHGIHSDIDKFINTQITIPKLGGAESLNVAVATGIILWEMNR